MHTYKATISHYRPREGTGTHMLEVEASNLATAAQRAARDTAMGTRKGDIVTITLLDLGVTPKKPAASE